MKQSAAFNWLVPLIALLALALAVGGVFSQSVDAPFEIVTAQGKTIEMYCNSI